MELVGVGIMLLVWLFVGLIGLAVTVFWILALVDCLTRRFEDPMNRVVWVLVIVFLHGVGAIIYWFVGRPQGTR
jgi:hypothetical protein